MIQTFSVQELIARGAFSCPCGKVHTAHLKKAVVGSGVIGAFGFDDCDGVVVVGKEHVVGLLALLACLQGTLHDDLTCGDGELHAVHVVFPSRLLDGWGDVFAFGIFFREICHGFLY